MRKNIKNRTIFCRDNLDILQNINSNTIDLIYLDPPFNKKKVFTAPIGSSAEGAGFNDYFREEDVKDEWLQTIKEDHVELYNFLNGIKNISNNKYYLYNYCYLAYMAIRLVEMQRILKDTGSIYFHCDPTMSHYIKLLMDIIFGEKNFRNEIVWSHQGSWIQPNDKYPRRHDILLYYGNSNNVTYNVLFEDNYEEQVNYKRWKKYIVGNAIYGKYMPSHDKRFATYMDAFIAKYGKNPSDKDIVLTITGKQIGTVQYIKVVDPKSKERTHYPTQKPLKLLERIIKASSNEGNMVLDPFCGCATTCVAAEKLNREWIGIDISVEAYTLVKKRLAKEVEWENTLFEESLVTFRTDPPNRTDKGKNFIKQKYVYIISHKQYPGEYKIGIASNVESRLNSYQTGDPNRNYRLEYSLATRYFREVERHIHDKYDNKHEWVMGDMEAIKKDIKAKHEELGGG